MAAKSIVKSGQILLAEPFMLDPYFRRSVVLLCEHHDDGSLGFIVNKGIGMKINDLIPDFPEFNAEVFYGGPVQNDTLHYIHNVGDILNESHQVAKGIWMGGDFQQLQALVTNQLIQPDNIRFFVGYSGWSSGQLDEEMEIGSWVTAPLDNNYIFNRQDGDLWSLVMYDKGDVYEVISGMSDFVNLN